MNNAVFFLPADCVEVQHALGPGLPSLVVDDTSGEGNTQQMCMIGTAPSGGGARPSRSRA